MNNQLQTLLGSNMFADLMRQDAENKREQRQALIAELNNIESSMAALMADKSLTSTDAALKKAEEGLKLARENRSSAATDNLNKRNAILKRQKLLRSEMIALTPSCLVNLREKLTEKVRGALLKNNDGTRIKQVYDSITSMAMTVIDADALIAGVNKLETQAESILKV
jgi:hypothetical protein